MSKAGDTNYKAFVGPPSRWDIQAALQFNVLTSLGLQEYHYVLDFGCGSLRAGRLLIPYLLPGHYFGIEPNRWLVHQGLKNELGCDIIRAKRPMFSDESCFDLRVFHRQRKKFDYIIAQSIFSHSGHNATARTISTAAQSMHFSSTFVFDYILGPSNYWADGWVYPGNVQYTRAYIRHLCKKSHLTYEEISVPLMPKNMIWVVATLEWSADDRLEEGPNG